MTKSVYVFDFDDTLMWAPEWHAQVIEDDHGFVVDGGDCPGVSFAMKFFEKLYKDHNKLLKFGAPKLPEELIYLKLKRTTDDSLDRSIFFTVTDANGTPVDAETMKLYFHKNVLKNAMISVNGRATKHAAVDDDFHFYRDPATLGTLGVNHDVFDILKAKHELSYILTARANVSGMREKIFELIHAHGQVRPIDVFLRDSHLKSGEHKGNAIINLAKQNDVGEIHYYEDWLRYIEAVQEKLKQYDEANLTNISDKVIIHHVSTDHKPKELIRKFY